MSLSKVEKRICLIVFWGIFSIWAISNICSQVFPRTDHGKAKKVVYLENKFSVEEMKKKLLTEYKGYDPETYFRTEDEYFGISGKRFYVSRYLREDFIYLKSSAEDLFLGYLAHRRFINNKKDFEFMKRVVQTSDADELSAYIKGVMGYNNKVIEDIFLDDPDIEVLKFRESKLNQNKCSEKNLPYDYYQKLREDLTFIKSVLLEEIQNDKS